MDYALFKVAVGTLFDHPETMHLNDEGQLVSTIGDEGLYGQACQVRTAPGGVTAAGVPLPPDVAEVVSFSEPTWILIRSAIRSETFTLC